MEIGDVAQLFGERCCIKQFSGCVSRASTGGGIRGKDLPRSNRLAMRDHQVCDQRSPTARLQPLDRWIA